MVIGEPVRELFSLSFWIKMSLVLIGAAVAASFQAALRRYGADADRALATRRTKCLAAAAFLIWCAVVVLGRLIAYDFVWGSWSLAPPT